MRVAWTSRLADRMRAAEKLLEAIAGIYPQARTSSPWCNVKGSVSPLIESHRSRDVVRPAPAGIRGATTRTTCPCPPWPVEQSTVRDTTLVVIISHLRAKAVFPRPGAKNLCYLLTR